MVRLLGIRYRTNTLPGSSGSPCFSQGWDLVALHHNGDPEFWTPTYNAAIMQALLLVQFGIFLNSVTRDICWVGNPFNNYVLYCNFYCTLVGIRITNHVVNSSNL